MCELLNRLFERQPAVLELLAQHAGRSFRLRAAPIEAAMTIGHDGRLSAADAAVVPDVVLSIDTARLWAEGWRPGQPFPERAGLIHVSGDAVLAQTLSMLAKSWRPDLEDLLSRYVGDLAAVQIVGGVKRATSLLRQFIGRSSQNIAEYVTHESELLTAGVSLREQSQDFRALRASLERMDVSVQKLQSRVEQLSVGPLTEERS